MPQTPHKTRIPESCWQVVLIWPEDGSLLTFKDWRGSAVGEFEGSACASHYAVILINNLIKLDFPHPDLYRRAGTMQVDW